MSEMIISKDGDNIVIDGFPDAVKLIKLEDPKAQRIADLLLHRKDLQFSIDCIDSINSVLVEPPTIREALWISAIIHFAKCFGSSKARFQLNREKIYKDKPEMHLKAFDFFVKLRNKNIVHDENPFSQSFTGAMLNNGKKPYKIEKIVCQAFSNNTLCQENFNSLINLLRVAFEWVVNEFDICCDVLTKELESCEYRELYNRSSIQYTVPKTEDVGNNSKEKP